MSWTRIDETPSRPGSFIGRDKHGYAEISSKTVSHTTWRCGACRALAVTCNGDEPRKCGKCR